MSTDNSKHLQIQKIKERLNAAVTKSGLNFHQLTNNINNSDDELTINYNTLKNALSYSNDALDITIVIAVCRYLHLDTAYILSPPDTPDINSETDKNAGFSQGKFIVLNNEKYFGEFKGFFFSSNPKKQEIDRMDLKIYQQHDTVVAEMTYHRYYQLVNGERKYKPIKLYGTPYLDTVHSNIFIQLTNDQGDFYLLFYNCQHFRSQHLFFRRGGAFTFSILRDFLPISINFVLFASEVPDDKLKYIPGLLSGMSQNFIIPKSEFEQLKKDSTLIQEFYKEFNYILDHDSEDTFYINENAILSAKNLFMEKEDIIKALLILKSNSHSLKHVVYDDPDWLSQFAKNFLQKP